MTREKSRISMHDLDYDNKLIQNYHEEIHIQRHLMKDEHFSIINNQPILHEHASLTWAFLQRRNKIDFI